MIEDTYMATELSASNYRTPQIKAAREAMETMAPHTTLIKRNSDIDFINAAFHRMTEEELDWFRKVLYRDAGWEGPRVLLRMLNEWERNRKRVTEGLRR